MDWSKVGKALADSAPVIGSLLGGPVGGAAGALIASTLGTANDPAAVLARIQSDPDTLLKIKQLEQDERDSLRNWQTLTLQAELADLQSARQAHAGHWMPSAITVCLAIMACAMASALIYLPIPETNRDLAINYAGQIFGLFGGAVAYWIGTSRSSRDKDQLLLNR